MVMCLATVYVEEHGEREPVMRDVAWIEPKDDGLQLVTLLGESRVLEAKIKSINLMDSLIVLEPATTESAPGEPGK
jgi:predicted RNA-binding protein